jgi:hypothetical protein
VRRDRDSAAAQRVGHLGESLLRQLVIGEANDAVVQLTNLALGQALRRDQVLRVVDRLGSNEQFPHDRKGPLIMPVADGLELHDVGSAIAPALHDVDRAQVQTRLKQCRRQLRYLSRDSAQVLEALLRRSWVLGPELRQRLDTSHRLTPSIDRGYAYRSKPDERCDHG